MDKELEEETLRAMIELRPTRAQMAFVFHVASKKRRASLAKGVPWEEWTRASTIKERQPAVVGLEPAPVEAGLQDGGEGHGVQTKVGFHGKTHPTAYGHVKKERPKLHDRRKGVFEGNEEITVQELKNLWNRMRPRRWNTVLQHEKKCDIEVCLT